MKKLLLFVCLTTLFACKKDDKSTDTRMNGVYESDGSVESTAVLLYTKNGTVTDTAIINAYIRRKWAQNPFYTTGHDTMSYRSTLTLMGDSAILKSNMETAAVICDVVPKNEYVSLLVQRDSVELFFTGTDSLYCGNIAHKMVGFPAAYHCVTGSTSHCFGFPQSPLAKKDDYFARPLMLYSFSQTSAGDATFCMTSQFDLVDYFDANVVGQFHTGDTLLLQTAIYFLRKK